MTRPLRVLLSAGEASGDKLGAGLARALRAEEPGIELLGMGGDQMAAAGVKLVQHASETAVVGFVEVLSHLPALRRAMRRLTEAIEREQPDLVVPIDFPDFNLRLAARAKRLGVPVVYFVSPQVWAWRTGRVEQIRDLVRRILVLFPFEVAFYERAGVPVTFVGHPAVEQATDPEAPAAAAARLGLDPGRPVVALLPGSRTKEVARHLPLLLEAAALLARRPDRPQFAIAKAPALRGTEVEVAAAAASVPGLTVVAGQLDALLAAATAGVVSSGTATLESAMAGLPMVVIYRMGALSWRIGKHLVRVDHIALPNLIAGRRIVPELLQEDCTPQRIADETGGLLSDRERRASVRRDLLAVRRLLGEPGVFGRAAGAVLQAARSR